MPNTNVVSEKLSLEPTAAQRFSGISGAYDIFRPAPPEAIITTLLALANSPRPQRVVDLGCGTGLSTHQWATHAHSVIGIDPSSDMLAYARQNVRARSSTTNVSFLMGRGDAMDIADASTDILTCASSIHWMEPQATFREITRVLKPAGVFAAYGPQMPFLPLRSWQTGAACTDFLAAAKKLDQQLDPQQQPASWRWPEILAYCRSSAGFRYVDELCFHHTVEWDAAHYCGWLATFSYVNNQLKANNAEMVDALAAFETTFRNHLGSDPTPLLISYRLILGIV
jgi:ubiquinone/menaquinone biosynthesis C-methylase UbiE